MTPNQVAEYTKVRTDHVLAMENGNYDVFMAPVFIRGFVRSYATMLKLDVPAVMATLDTELKQTQKFRDPPALTPPAGGVLDWIMLQLSKVNLMVVLPLLVISLLVWLSVYGYQAWRRHKTADPLVNLGPGLYQAKPGLSAVYLPVPTPTNPPGAATRP